MTRSPRRLASRAASLLVVLLAAGCSASPPTNFYTLASLPPDASTVAAARQPLGIVALGPVRLPDYVDRPQIVTRTGTYAMSLAAFDQWAGPLDDMVPRVLVEDLTQRLPADRVVSFPRVSGPNFDYRIALEVTRFDVEPGGLATLTARWQVYDSLTPRARLVADETFTHQANGNGYEDYAAALSVALAELSERLIDNLNGVRGSPPTPLTAP